VPDPPAAGDWASLRAGQPETTWDLPAREATFEHRMRFFSLPVTLVLAWAVAHAGMLHLLQRIVFGMWVHETGHAVAAWLCGRFAFPGPWFTPVAESRSWWVTILVASAIVAAANSLRRERLALAFAVAGLLPIQAFCTFALSERAARSFILWSGDGGCIVLGTLLMLTFYARENSSIRTGWLRWGFLVIGASAFADGLATWWTACGDRDAIPFGEIENRCPSDPTVLVYQQGWTIPGLVDGYVLLGVVCLIVLAIFYFVGLRREAVKKTDVAS
jgi:hypothetical protein